MGNRLEGRVAIVTGAGRGIGRAHALSLASEGARVVVNDLGGGPGGQTDDASAEPADEVVAAVKDAGGEAVANYNNVTSMEAGEAIVQAALDTYGRLDILVNNAGILRDRMIYNMTEEEWDIVIAVHLKGHFTTMRPAARIFRQQRSGRIINTSSESGLGNMGQGNYAAAKEGIVGLTRAAARDLGRYGVTVNALRPRAGTRLTLNPELLRQIERKRESERPGDAKGAAADAGDPTFVMLEEAYGPENVSPFVTWLCTDEAANINGRTFLVGGGEITLHTDPEPEGTVFSSGLNWSVDEVSEVAKRTFLSKIKNVAPPKG